LAEPSAINGRRKKNMKIETANQLSGMATGAIFLTVFGALWMALSLYSMQYLGVATMICGLLALAAMLLAAVYLLRQAKRWPRMPKDPAMSRAFAWINAIQWIAIFVVGFVLGRMHLYAYIPTAIIAIVGLHFFPLARLFHNPPHYGTGAVLVAWAAASAVVLPAGQLPGIACFVTGLIFWHSAAMTMAVALHAVRESASSLVH
jgi:hypothetical protein